MSLPALPGTLREPLPLFVYGTLADPELAGNLLERRVTPEGGRLPGFEKVWFEGFDFPTILANEEETVEGTVYRGLTEEDFRRIDAYEGVREGLYQRVRVEIEIEGRPEREPGYVYLVTDKTMRRLTR